MSPALDRLSAAASAAGADFLDPPSSTGTAFTLPGLGVVVADLDGGNRPYLMACGDRLNDGVLATVLDLLTGVVASE